MKRIMLFILLFPLLASCCVNKAADKTPQCILYLEGDAIHISEADSLIEVSLSLLENSDDVLRLAVSPEMTAEIKLRDTALEIIFPEPFEIITAFGRKQKINNILIPLSGDHGPGPDMSSVMIITGVDGYVDGPNQNNFARPDLLRLWELLKL